MKSPPRNPPRPDPRIDWDPEPAPVEAIPVVRIVARPATVDEKLDDLRSLVEQAITHGEITRGCAERTDAAMVGLTATNPPGIVTRLANEILALRIGMQRASAQSTSRVVGIAAVVAGIVAFAVAALAR